MNSPWRSGIAIAWSALALFFAFFPTLAGADVLVLQDGSRVQTMGKWEVKGRQIVFKSQAGALSALRLAEVDLAASEKATAEALAPKPAAQEQPKKQPVMVITNEELARLFPRPALPPNVFRAARSASGKTRETAPLPVAWATHECWADNFSIDLPEHWYKIEFGLSSFDRSVQYLERNHPALRQALKEDLVEFPRLGSSFLAIDLDLGTFFSCAHFKTVPSQTFDHLFQSMARSFDNVPVIKGKPTRQVFRVHDQPVGRVDAVFKFDDEILMVQYLLKVKSEAIVLIFFTLAKDAELDLPLFQEAVGRIRFQGTETPASEIRFDPLKSR